MIATDLGEQQAVDADPKAIQQINFPANTKMFFIIKESKATILDFSQGIVRVFSISFTLIYLCKMTHYNTLNVKLSRSQLRKLKLWIKNGAEVTQILSLNVVSISNGETNFLHKSLSTKTSSKNM